MSETKIDKPTESDMATIGCKCDFCGKKLDGLKKIWIWNEHFACCRDHAQRAQANTNAIKSVEAFKRSYPQLNGLKPKKAIVDEFTSEERDIDLL